MNQLVSDPKSYNIFLQDYKKMKEKKNQRKVAQLLAKRNLVLQQDYIEKNVEIVENLQEY